MSRVSYAANPMQRKLIDEVISSKNVNYKIIRQVREKSKKRNIIVMYRTVQFTFAFIATVISHG